MEQVQDIKIRIASVIKEEMDNQGYSIRSLAKELGISAMTVQRILNSPHKSVAIDYYLMILNLLDIKIELI